MGRVIKRFPLLVVADVILDGATANGPSALFRADMSGLDDDGVAKRVMIKVKTPNAASAEKMISMMRFPGATIIGCPELTEEDGRIKLTFEYPEFLVNQGSLLLTPGGG